MAPQPQRRRHEPPLPRCLQTHQQQQHRCRLSHLLLTRRNPDDRRRRTKSRYHEPQRICFRPHLCHETQRRAIARRLWTTHQLRPYQRPASIRWQWLRFHQTRHQRCRRPWHLLATPHRQNPRTRRWCLLQQHGRKTLLLRRRHEKRIPTHQPPHRHSLHQPHRCLQQHLTPPRPQQTPRPHTPRHRWRQHL